MNSTLGSASVAGCNINRCMSNHDTCAESSPMPGNRVAAPSPQAIVGCSTRMRNRADTIPSDGAPSWTTAVSLPAPDPSYVSTGRHRVVAYAGQLPLEDVERSGDARLPARCVVEVAGCPAIPGIEVEDAELLAVGKAAHENDLGDLRETKRRGVGERGGRDG
jgi:hypothetical protein